jgi:beta-phosphoglucomutase-like phosphatase (HAD superfamily)
MFPLTALTLNIDNVQLKVSDQHLDAALQYSPTPGMQPLLEWLKALQIQIHNPKVPFDISLGVGSQVMIYNLRMFYLKYFGFNCRHLICSCKMVILSL